MLSGSTSAKAAHGMLIKLTPGYTPDLMEYIFPQTDTSRKSNHCNAIDEVDERLKE